jgi:hypothetical protein
MLYFMIKKLNYSQCKSSLQKFSCDEYCVWSCHTVETCSGILDHISASSEALTYKQVSLTQSHMQQHYLQNFKPFLKSY